jgi:hypothetical protein
MSDKLIIPGGLCDAHGNVAPPEADPGDITPLLSPHDREVIQQMQEAGIIQPEPAATPALEPHAGRNSVVFTISDEHDHVVCGLIPPTTYVMVSPQRFQFDAFGVITRLLLSPAGQSFVRAQGWEVYRP